MGKHKKQKKHQGTLDSTVADGAVCAAVDDLWKLLQNSSSDRLKVLWEEYDHIQDRIAGLRDLQRPGISNVTRRAEKMPFFEKWLQEYGAVYVDLAIMETPDNGFGLRSTRELKCDEKVLEIPDKLMMTSQSAIQGELGGLIDADEMLRSMPNVSLALHLLNEKYNPNSFWKPYIDTLPQSFSLPLYFNKQELLLLQSSPCLVKCLLQIRNITKLYSHLHKLIRTTAARSLPIVKSSFRYDDFIWAVSCVMSRQNEIPSKPGHPSPTLALIPLWDLCNHRSGQITTFYNVETLTCDCYAQCDFKVDEEFRIFYGPRTNSVLLLQQGFVYVENEHDHYPIKLGLSSMEEEKTRSLRIKLLQLIDVQISGLFLLTKSKEHPFTPDLLSFVRIFTAPFNKLEEFLQDEVASRRLKGQSLTEQDLPSLEFLEKRCSLLLASYPTTISEDERMLESTSTICSTQAILMRLCEKKILMDAVHYAKRKWDELHATLPTKQ